VKSRNRQNGKPRATTTDKGRRQKLKPPRNATPFFISKPTTTLSMAGKCRENLTFESSFNGHYKAEREKERQKRQDSHSSLRPFCEAHKCEPATQPGAQNFPAARFPKLLHTWTQKFSAATKKKW